MRLLDWREVPFEEPHSGWYLVDTYVIRRTIPSGIIAEVAVTYTIYYDFIRRQMIRHQAMLRKITMEVADLPNAINK